MPSTRDIAGQLDELSKAQVEELAAAAGIEHKASITKKDLVSLVTEKENVAAIAKAYDELVEEEEEAPADEEVEEEEAIEGDTVVLDPDEPELEIPVEEPAPATEPEEEYGRPGITPPAPVNVSGNVSDHGNKDYVDVVRFNQYVRTYSKKVHGSGYKDMAIAMARKEKNDDGEITRSLVEPGVITRIVVHFEETDTKDPNVKHKRQRVFEGGKECTFKEQAKEFAQAVQGEMFFK